MQQQQQEEGVLEQFHSHRLRRDRSDCVRKRPSDLPAHSRRQQPPSQKGPASPARPSGARGPEAHRAQPAPLPRRRGPRARAAAAGLSAPSGRRGKEAGGASTGAASLPGGRTRDPAAPPPACLGPYPPAAALALSRAGLHGDLGLRSSPRASACVSTSPAALSAARTGIPRPPHPGAAPACRGASPLRAFLRRRERRSRPEQNPVANLETGHVKAHARRPDSCALPGPNRKEASAGTPRMR